MAEPSTTDGGGGPAQQAEHKARVFAYTLSSADPKKGGPTKAEMDRVAALFPPSTLPGLASHLQALMRRSGAVDASGAPVSPQPDALLAGAKRVFHFRAHYLIYWLLADKEKGLREISTERDAFALAQLLFASKVPFLFTRCKLRRSADGRAYEKGADPSGKRDASGKVKALDVVDGVSAAEGGSYFELGPDSGKGAVRYYWVYEGGQHWNSIKLGIIMALVLSFNMYQLWPYWARNIVWYLSVTMLLFILGVCVLQGILFLLVWPTGYSFWLLPNFTSDDAPIWLLFSPVYTFERSKGSNAYLRAALIALIAAAAYFVVSVPSTEWLDFIDSQGKIVSDLYSGTLLTDGKEGADGALTSGSVRFENPFIKTWGPGKYMGRAVPVPSLADLDKLGAEEAAKVPEAALVDDEEGGGGSGGGEEAAGGAAAAAAAAEAAEAAAAAAGGSDKQV